ncbi:MAG: hypothetical protein F9K44_06200 [Hyphomicrobiaceae bacterium]|nr:MAG: hypothetical protein F9K44_06200 [Hyphomicrobiaceae bacterium]
MRHHRLSRGADRRRSQAPLCRARGSRTFVRLQPKPGTLLLWESWLRHEVKPSSAAGDRISVSFNFALA